jgi:hypothetical protein
VLHILTYLQSHVTTGVFSALQEYHGEFFVCPPQTTDRGGNKYFGLRLNVS